MRIHLKVIGLILLLATGCGITRQATGWTADIYSFAQTDTLLLAAPRPLVVFLYADWCRYCQHMEQTTFRQPEVVSLLDSAYYFLPFNGESEAPVFFRDQTYYFQPTGHGQGTHQLAEALGSTRGQVVYPSLIILNEERETVFRYQGFLDGESLAVILWKVLTDRHRQ
ncbi:MAG: thioredoxin family protein [Lewinella sp.]|nr:thioredoxin family protein [Lewinella sp.]